MKIEAIMICLLVSIAPNEVSRSQIPSRYLVRIIIIISRWCVHHAVTLSVTASFSLLIPSSPIVLSKSQTPRSRHFSKISQFYWIHPMILEKIRSCLAKLKLGLQTCALIRLLGPSGPNVISRPHTP